MAVFRLLESYGLKEPNLLEKECAPLFAINSLIYALT